MQVIGVQHTGFSVIDLDRSIEFFGLLGCEVIWRREITDAYFREIVGLPDTVVQAAHLRIPATDHILELFQYEPQDAPTNLEPNQPGHAHLCFLVDDLPAAYETLRAKGVRFKSPPVLITAGVNTGGYGAYVVDPNGITLELFQKPRPS